MEAFQAPDFQEVGRLSQDTGLSPLVTSLLIQRGMGTADEVEDFLDPNRDKMHTLLDEGHGQSRVSDHEGH